MLRFIFLKSELNLVNLRLGRVIVSVGTTFIIKDNDNVSRGVRVHANTMAVYHGLFRGMFGVGVWIGSGS